MRFNDTIDKLLKSKGRDVWSVRPEDSVHEAFKLMAQKSVGALPVVEGDSLLGMLSERDYARKMIVKGRDPRKTKVRSIMSSHVISVGPQTTVDECMKIMTVKRFRHLPVVKDGIIEGVISIGDLVRWVITSQEETIQRLEDYISGKYPA